MSKYIITVDCSLECKYEVMESIHIVDSAIAIHMVNMHKCTVNSLPALLHTYDITGTNDALPLYSIHNT